MVDLGTLGGDTSAAYAINQQGQVVGVSAPVKNDYGFHAFLWDDGTMTDLGTFGPGNRSAEAINDHGQVGRLERQRNERGLDPCRLMAEWTDD